jgi:microcystin-dependent protein
MEVVMALVFNTIQQRRGTAAEWAAANPILAEGEEGYETDTGYLKIGDGTTHWNSLNYFPSSSSSEWTIPAVSGLAYIAATQFSVLGDKTATFPIGIRVKAVCTAGTIYGEVTNSSASGTPEITTVTVAWDTGSLDSGLSAISVGIFSPVNTSIPSMFYVRAGMVLPYGGDTAPTGWLLCYGQAVSRTTYADLFAIIGVKFGAGDGTNTFNVPDLRGRMIIGPDNMGGGAASRVAAAVSPGDNGGVEEIDLSHVHTTGDHALTESELPVHTHPTYLLTRTMPLGGGAAYTTPDYATSGGVTGSTGGGAAHEHGDTGSAGDATQAIMNPYCAINYIIRC